MGGKPDILGEPVVEAKEIAKTLNVSLRKVHHWIRSGMLPGFHLRGTRIWLVRKVDLVDVIAPVAGTSKPQRRPQTANANRAHEAAMKRLRERGLSL